MASTFSAFRNPNYRTYFAGQMLSMSGTWMQQVVQSWLVYRLTQSGLWLGLITFATQAPAFLVAPFAGVAVDSFNRRRMLIIIEVLAMLQAFALTALVLTNQIELWHIALLGTVLGLINAFEMTTRHTFAVDMVGKEDLASAISLNSVIINTSRIIGPALAGALIFRIGEGWCFFINGLSYLAVILGLLKIVVRVPELRNHTGESTFHQIHEAWKYARGKPFILKSFALATFLSIVGFSYMVLLPVFAQKVLHGDARVLAWLTCFNGIGAMVGSLTSGSFANRWRIKTRVTLNVLVLGLALVSFGLSHQPWLSYLSIFFVGSSLMRVFPALNTTIQLLVSDHIRGRIMSFYMMTFLGATPIGHFAAGWLSDHIGASMVTVGSGIICFIVGIILTWDFVVIFVPKKREAAA